MLQGTSQQVPAAAAAAAQARPATSVMPNAASSAEFLMRLLVDVLRDVSCGSSAHPHQDQAAHSAMSQVLEACMAVLKVLVQREDGGVGLWGGVDAVELLTAAGMVNTLCGMLRVLGPPLNPRQKAAVEVQEQQTEQQQQQQAEAGSSSHDVYPDTPPYLGYRSDITAILANALYARPAVQELVQELGGIDLLLACCQLDDMAPLAKEWALWGIRNLCQHSTSAREYIASLEPVEAVTSPQLDKLGMAVEMDKRTGKFKLVQKQVV